MTNLEALKANVSQVHGFVVSDNAFSKALLDEEISESETYSKANENSIDLATIRIYRQILSAPGMSEGDVSYSPKDVKAIEKSIDSLLLKWGLPCEFGSIATVNSIARW